jgi:hypothetical protein
MVYQAITLKKKFGHKTLVEGHADCFFNKNGAVHYNFVTVQQMVDSTIYTKVLKCHSVEDGGEVEKQLDLAPRQCTPSHFTCSAALFGKEQNFNHHTVISFSRYCSMQVLALPKLLHGAERSFCESWSGNHTRTFRGASSNGGTAGPLCMCIRTVPQG